MSGSFTWQHRRNGPSCGKGRMAWRDFVGTVSADDSDLFIARSLVEQLGQSVTVSPSQYVISAART
ncbi:MAG: hypothetical protein E5299_00840 [Burkholderia gladioli]|nr:MAG: hypothetical protein E5299_00840 [Burkholderia gladioli]